MKNRLLITLMFAFSIANGWAKFVPVNYAKQIATNFYAFEAHTKPSTVELVYTGKDENTQGLSNVAEPMYYVFNIDGNKGFVMVTAEDLVTPILGYSTQNAFTPNNLAPSLRKWLENYKDQIRYVKINRTETTKEIIKKWNDYYDNNFAITPSRSTNSVNPLCVTTWNQSPFYNDSCPYDNRAGALSVTGCVATAMSQIMKFWNYPPQGVGFHSYNEPNAGALSANFGSTNYNWANMPNDVSSGNSEVARLMFHCGVAVEMTYSANESAAYVVASASPGQACAEYAYKTYFGYDPATLQGVERKNYADADWYALLKGELDAGRPFEYAGFGQGGGHTWVCDGYDNNSPALFHMNWGWGGNSNGNFDLTTLDPSSLGAGGGTGGFNSNQQCVIGIKPLNNGGGGNNTINPDSIQMAASLTVSANPYLIGDPFTVYANIVNSGGASFNGTLAAALFNSDGVFVQFIQELTNQTIAAGTTVSDSFYINTLSAIPGTFTVGIYYKKGNNNYSLVAANGYINPGNVTFSGAYDSITMASTITVGTSNTITAGQPFSGSFQIHNDAYYDFSDTVGLVLYDLKGNNGVVIDYKPAFSVFSGNTATYSFNSTGVNVAGGSYYLAVLFHDATYGRYFLAFNGSYGNPAKIKVITPPLNPDIYEANNTEQTAYVFTPTFNGNTAHVKTTGSNLHTGSDYDYYTINLPQGTYTVEPRVFDSNAPDGVTNYTDDVIFSYKTSGGTYSPVYDNVAPWQTFTGNSLTFAVSNYFPGNTGSYLLDVLISIGSVGINEAQASSLNIYPNPASNSIIINTGDLSGRFELGIYDMLGNKVIANTMDVTKGTPITQNLNSIDNGMYIVRLTSNETTKESKIIVNH